MMMMMMHDYDDPVLCADVLCFLLMLVPKLNHVCLAVYKCIYVCMQVLKLQAEIEDTMAQAEAKGEEGEVDEAEELMQKVEELKQQKAQVQSKLVAEAVANGTMDASGE